MKRTTVSEGAVVLAPHGRDGEIATRLLGEVGIAVSSVKSLDELIGALDHSVAFVVLADDALERADASGLARWVGGQEPWSDLPFILLTRQGGGPERNPLALRHLDLLGNVTFLERPFHPSSFASLAKAALRQRRRQYAARATAELARTRLAEIEGIYAQAHVGLCVLDRDLRFVRVNERLAEMNGLPAAEHVGRSVREIVPNLADAAEALARRIFDTGIGEKDIEIVGETAAEPGVERIWIEQWMPLRDVHGYVHCINISVEEVTEQRRAAKRQQALLRLTEGLLDHETDERAIAERVHREVSPLVGADLLFNYRVADEAGALKLVFGGGLPEDRRQAVEALRPGVSLCGMVAAAGRRMLFDEAALEADPRGGFVRSTGGKVYACHPLAARDGRVLGTLSFESTRRRRFDQFEADFLQTVANYVAQAWDRLEMLRAERQVEMRTRLVLDGALAFIGLLTPKGIPLEANKAALEAGGVARDEVIGKPFWDCIWWSYAPEAGARLKAAVNEASQGSTVRYEAVVRMAGDSRMTIDFMLAPIFDADGHVEYLVPSGFDISERVRAQERQKLLADELAHRGKNLLSVVQTIVMRSLSSAADMREAREAASGRIQALAHTYDALRATDGETAQLRDIILAEFAALPQPPRIDGPPVALTARAAQTFGLIVHELGTNAVKYGALSVPGGRVEIDWRMVKDADGERLRFQWRERGGQPARPPSRRGFGTILLTNVAGADFRCTPQLDYGHDGLSYRIDAVLQAADDA